jgi:WD40 repeat protein
MIPVVRRAADGAILATAPLAGACDGDHPSILVWSPDGRSVAATSKVGCSVLWDVGRGTVRPLAIGSSTITRFAFSPDGRWLAAAGSDRKARVWDTADGRMVTLTGHTDVLMSVAFSPDGRQLATASYDKTVRLWQVGGGWRARVLRGHAASVDEVVFLPGGGRLVTAARDGTLRLWDAADHPRPNAAELRERMAALTTTVIGPDARVSTLR